MWRPFFVFRIGPLLPDQFIHTTGKSTQTRTQLIQLTLLAIHHITQLVIGALQKRDLQFDLFEICCIHDSWPQWGYSAYYGPQWQCGEK